MNADEIIETLRHDAYSLRRSAAGELLAAAADLIENQRRHIAALLQINANLRNVWVPASDRLPAQDGQYLCLYSFLSGGHARSVLHPSVLDYYATDARPHFQYEDYRGMHVSYWMPLPPVPEVDDG